MWYPDVSPSRSRIIFAEMFQDTVDLHDYFSHNADDLIVVTDYFVDEFSEKRSWKATFCASCRYHYFSPIDICLHPNNNHLLKPNVIEPFSDIYDKSRFRNHILYDLNVIGVLSKFSKLFFESQSYSIGQILPVQHVSSATETGLNIKIQVTEGTSPKLVLGANADCLSIDPSSSNGNPSAYIGDDPLYQVVYRCRMGFDTKEPFSKVGTGCDEDEDDDDDPMETDCEDPDTTHTSTSSRSSSSSSDE